MLNLVSHPFRYLMVKLMAKFFERLLSDEDKEWEEVDETIERKE